MTGCEFRMRKYAHFCNVPSPFSRTAADRMISSEIILFSYQGGSLEPRRVLLSKLMLDKNSGIWCTIIVEFYHD